VASERRSSEVGLVAALPERIPRLDQHRRPHRTTAGGRAGWVLFLYHAAANSWSILCETVGKLAVQPQRGNSMQLYFSPLACSMATRIALYEAGANAHFRLCGRRRQEDRGRRRLSGDQTRSALSAGVAAGRLARCDRERSHPRLSRGTNTGRRARKRRRSASNGSAHQFRTAHRRFLGDPRSRTSEEVRAYALQRGSAGPVRLSGDGSRRSRLSERRVQRR